MPPRKDRSDLKEPLLSSNAQQGKRSDDPTPASPSTSTALTVAPPTSKPKPNNDSDPSLISEPSADGKEKKPEKSLEEILKEEQDKSNEFLAQREARVKQFWWLMLGFHAVVFTGSILSWALYYESDINFFTKKGFVDLISKYNYRTSLSDLMAATVLRTVLTSLTLMTTFSDEKRILLLNSTAYWTTAMVFVLALCKAMVISYHTGADSGQSPLSTGQNVYRIVATIISAILALGALLLHQWFNPLDLEIFQDDEIQQQEFVKRQKLHAQEQEDLEFQAALLSGPELAAFLLHKENVKRKYEEVEHQLKRARMTAKEMEDGATFSEFIWLLKPYFWPRGFVPKLVVFSTWAVLIGSKVCSIMAPIQIGHATDQLQIQGTVPWKYFTLFCALTFGTSALKQLQSIIYLRVKQQAFVELSGNLMEHILSLSLSWHHSKTLGKTTRSVMRGLTAGESLISYLFLMLLPSAFEALTIFILFFQKFKQPLISAIIFFHLAVYSIATIQLTILRKPMRQKARAMDNKYHDILTDALQNIEIVKLYNKEKSEAGRYTQAIQYYQESTITTQATLSVLNGLQTFIIQSCLCLSLFVVGYDIAHGQLNLGTLSSIIAFMGNLFAPLSWLGSIYDVVIQAFIDAGVVLEIQRLKPEVVEYGNAVPLTFDERAPLIEFKDLTFHYDPVLKHGVDNINLTINRGESVAIVGSTGSGKSTLTKLLLRFFDPQLGSIHINGQDIKYATNASLKEAVILVPQDTNLFNDTILNNIIYSHPNATHDEIIKSCTLAGILDFVVSLNLGFYTPVGERGLRMSGGQRQRLCIARSMLKRFRGAQGSSTEVLLQKDKDNEAQSQQQLPLPTSTSQPTGINSSPLDYAVSDHSDNKLSMTLSGLSPTELELNQSAKDYVGTDAYHKDTKVAKELLGIGRIIVADEASSAVDTITERLIQSAMRVLEEGATTIAITHRLTYVTHFDRIVVMANGRIIEQGTHEQLLNMNGTYALMYAQQFVKEKITDISPEELATTLNYVKEFTTNPIFSGGGISAASLSDLKSGNLIVAPPHASDADNGTAADTKGQQKDEKQLAVDTTSAAASTATTPVPTPSNISTNSDASFGLLPVQLASAEAIEQAKNSLKMGHIYNKVFNNPANQRGRR